MVKVVAVREYRHGGKTHAPGEEVDVSEKDARVLTRVKNAPFKLASDKSPKYRTPDPSIEQPRVSLETSPVPLETSPVEVEAAVEVPEGDEDKKLPKRRYMRRDMRPPEKT